MILTIVALSFWCYSLHKRNNTLEKEFKEYKEATNNYMGDVARKVNGVSDDLSNMEYDVDQLEDDIDEVKYYINY